MKPLPAMMLFALLVLPASGREEITPATRETVRRGLDWLAGTQSKEGGWGTSGEHDVATTAVAGMAFLSHGDTPGRGDYADSVSRAVSYLLARSDPATGLIASPGESRLIHCHGYAMLFLGEVYGMEVLPDQRERIGTVLRRAVKLSVSAQTDRGGWGYSPGDLDDEGSTTVTQVEGLRSCRNAGITVPIQTINRALEYLRKSQNPDGSIRYKVSHPGQGSAALTAAGLMCFYSLGDYAGDNTKRALRFLQQALRQGRMSQGQWLYYTRLYAAQAFYLAGGPDWESYWQNEAMKLPALQDADGSWKGDIHPAFDTAVACIILQIPYRYLPILQR